MCAQDKWFPDALSGSGAVRSGVLYTLQAVFGRVHRGASSSGPPRKGTKKLLEGKVRHFCWNVFLNLYFALK